MNLLSAPPGVTIGLFVGLLWASSGCHAFVTAVPGGASNPTTNNGRQLPRSSWLRSSQKPQRRSLAMERKRQRFQKRLQQRQLLLQLGANLDNGDKDSDDKKDGPKFGRSSGQSSAQSTAASQRRGGSTQLEMVANPQDTDDKSSRRTVIVGFGLALLLGTTAMAKFNVLPGPLFTPTTATTESIISYTDSYVLQDAGVSLLTAVLGYAFAKAVTIAYDKGYLTSKESRKIIHTLSAPLFILFWPLFSEAHGSQVFAAIVPMLNAFRLYLASQGKGEKSLAMAVSRSGSPEEALQGPFIYVCIMAVALLAFWRNTAAGIVSLVTMAVGDGLADLVGRRYGKSNPWPGMDKSVAGSMAFWIGSTFAMVGLLQWMQYWGCLNLAVDLSTSDLWLRATLIGFLTAALELVPVGDDNYNVPLAGALLGWYLFPV